MQLRAISFDDFTSPRAGEIKWGQVLTCLPSSLSANTYNDVLEQAWADGHRTAIVAVPESLGARANLGRAGAETSLTAWLPALANLQVNAASDPASLLVVGAIECDDLQAQSEILDLSNPNQLNQLRDLVAELDTRVIAVLQPLFTLGFDVVLIGGGHNNAYPLLKSLASACKSPVGAMNLDPHSDFRSCEGRHSGNGFRYAYSEGFLQHYHVVGLHPARNNADSLSALSDAGFNYTHLDILRTKAWDTLTVSWQQCAAAWQVPFGIEVDLDAVTGMPASAMNYAGIDADQVFSYIAGLAQLPQARYLHLTEAAPCLHPAGLAAGNRMVGQIIIEGLLAYLNARAAQS
ncbi:arginase [Pseudidiomarina aestuarii]|uniref:Arginase n=1 Tax=Pseudidiomarina aestuarii TaxID=624146 RepID=A0A7Z6ZRU4_9GAMM|nr:arginase family protein [Pseudidiomarina aestuarii]RUO39003.1 arginase [Pseudidiomarina aestuarii]